MPLFAGIDVGSVSAKMAVIGFSFDRLPDAETIAAAGYSRAAAHLEEVAGTGILLSRYSRTFGKPIQAVRELLEDLRGLTGGAALGGLRITGSGARLAAKGLSAGTENEFKAIARGVRQLYPEVRTVFEIGGESSKYLRLAERGSEREATGSDGYTYGAGIADYSTSGECAAGTGSFLDQQASRLKYRVEEIGEVVSQAKSAARIAGRCSVFAKSDMIHAQQKGYSTGEVLKGLCEAVARNFKSNIVRGKPVVARVGLIGGVAQNSGVVQALTEVFRLREGQLFVPAEYAWLGALGCALLERDTRQTRERSEFAQGHKSYGLIEKPDEVRVEPLSLANVLLLRDHPEASRTEPLPASGERVDTYLGIDIGSVSTNLALLDEEGRLLHGIYLRTSGRPIEVVQEGLQEIDRLFGEKVVVQGVGTTGSGRELIGELVGADTVNDEITAHKTGAMFVHRRLVKPETAEATNTPEEPDEVDTIFEIGGQDSKFISIDNGVVVDFAMNEACAAGTGSFLEEQAERLGIQIKEEFAAKALASDAPARLGERCTVFMERDVTAATQAGAPVGDLAAGLAYSVAWNYLNRVVRGRKIGKVIYFQGGTAYNNAVAAAFSQILGRRIIVPPHNGIIGAIGMALIAQEVMSAKGNSRSEMRPVAALAAAAGAGARLATSVMVEEGRGSFSAFRGFDLNRVSFETREFVCKACSNFCDMKEISVEGRKTYWGDKCSDKFRKRARTERRPVIADLVALRELLLRRDFRETASAARPARGRVGIPQAMYFYDQFPFWQTYLRELGFEVVVSGATDQGIATRGAELSLTEPCFPVQIAHGQVQSLFLGTAHRPAVDYVLLPNVMDREGPEGSHASCLCPWNQTLPYVLRAAPEFGEFAERILAPTIYCRAGRKHVEAQLAAYFRRFGVRARQIHDAMEKAFAAQADFQSELEEEGRQACATLRATGAPAVILVGRPYNLYDRNANCDIPRKLRDLYGVNVLPLDFLPLDEYPVLDRYPNMFWHSGRRILEAGKFAAAHRGMHIIYLTNFKCGPDSFTKHFLREISGSPFLVLQFDGHGNDAGYLTRCEAYLDSKGLLRCQHVN